MGKIDYSALPLAKPGPKRKPDSGRTQHNSTLKSYKALAPVGKNEERQEEKYGPQCEACRNIGVCSACGSRERCDPHHEPPVSLGGLDFDATPLCRTCHDERGNTTARKFWRKYRTDPEDVKAAVRAWMAAGCPQGELPFGGRR